MKTDKRDARTLCEACRLGAPARVRDMDLPATLASELEPILALLEPLNTQIAAADRRLTTLVSAPKAGHVVERSDERGCCDRSYTGHRGQTPDDRIS